MHKILTTRHTSSIYAWLLPCALAMAVLTGCSRAADILYLDDIVPNVTINVQDPRPIKLQPGDRINISVHSRDKELVEMFNLSVGGSGGSSSGGSRNSNNLAAYTVDENGNIEMPIIGSVNVLGLTRLELQNAIRYKLLASKLVRDPIVTVEFVDMGYYVLGELGAGKHAITRDQITLLEAISESGDLTLQGRRDNILVLRTVDGQQTPYLVNILKTDDLYSSPVYYLQQNDIIYVKPDEMKVDSTNPMGNAFRTPTFWIGMFNFGLSLVLLFTKI